MSPPARGAWIEIMVGAEPINAPLSRPPHGGRGLKSGQIQKIKQMIGSPPARGAWIEIADYYNAVVSEYVAPRTGGVD